MIDSGGSIAAEKLPFSQQEIEDMLGDFASIEAASTRDRKDGENPAGFPFLPIEDDQRSIAAARNKRLGAVIAAAVACFTLMAGLAYGAASGNLSREPELPQIATSSPTNEDAQAPAPVATIAVKAPGYDETASPLAYRVTGTASAQEGGADASEDSVGQEAEQAIDFYGTVDANAMQAIDEDGMPIDDEFSVVLDTLPAGSYIISWSNSILSDGSYYQVPEATQFEVVEEDITLKAQFQKVDGATASAEDVKATYESIESWLKGATGNVADHRDDILKTAKANAEKAALVREAGGLDGVGQEGESVSEEDVAAGEAEEIQENMNWYEDTNATQDYAPTGGGSPDSNSGNPPSEGQVETDAGDSAAAAPTAENAGSTAVGTDETTSPHEDTTNYETYPADSTDLYEYYRLQEQEAGQS